MHAYTPHAVFQPVAKCYQHNGIRGVLQGDLLFTDDKKNAVVGNEKSIVFTPNTITYAVPTTSVDMYNRIRAAKIGDAAIIKSIIKILDSEKIYLKGKITDIERFQKIIDTWSLTSESLKDQVIHYFNQFIKVRPFFM